MSEYIEATDVHPGDMLAHVGKVESILILGDEIVFTMHWTDRRELRVALDAEIWVDRQPEVA